MATKQEACDFIRADLVKVSVGFRQLKLSDEDQLVVDNNIFVLREIIKKNQKAGDVI